ncbi:MAG: hypothetical protein SH857_04470 [Chitinophagales bacterium]|nr:hypothetical protein [Chitinophagales bacterium]
MFTLARSNYFSLINLKIMKTLLLSLLCLLFLREGQTQPRELTVGVEQSLKKSADYFRSVGTDVGRTDVAMLLFILQEHFNYSLGLSSVTEYKKQNLELQTSYFKLYNTYFDGRNALLFDDNTVNEYLQGNLYTLDGLTLWSMFCNKFPLPDNYLKILHENAEMGDYEMTHAALQLGNILNTQCVKPGEATEALREKLVKGLVNEMNSNIEFKSSDDLKYQCMAMLYYLGKGNMIKDEQIQLLLKNQLSNGGWAPNAKEGGEANVHTSVLALWVLLEYQNRKN